MKLFITIILALCFSLIIHAQPYFNDGARWEYGLYPNDTNSYVLIEKTGEVLRGIILCDELKFQEITYSSGTQTYTYVRYTFQSGDTVYIENPDNGSYGILYTFNLSAGDTTGCSLCSDAFIIDSISTVEIGMWNLKIQHFSLLNNTYMTIEKIGNTGFLIPHVTATGPMPPGYMLRCYSDNEGLSFRTGDKESCNSGEPISTEPLITAAFGFDGVTVRSESIQPGTEIRITNALGQTVAVDYATQSGQNFTALPLLADGIYFVSIRNGSEIASEKFNAINYYWQK